MPYSAVRTFIAFRNVLGAIGIAVLVQHNAPDRFFQIRKIALNDIYDSAF